MSDVASYNLWSRIRAASSLLSGPQRVAVVLLLCAVGIAIIWAGVTSWRYKTHPLSRNTYIVEDRLLGSVYFCSASSCRPTEMRSPSKPTPKAEYKATHDSLNEISDAAAAASGEDWSRLNDDQFMEAILGESLDDFAGSSNGTQQGRE